jgi:nicotinamidase-related amidase
MSAEARLRTALLVIDVQQGFRDPRYKQWSTPDFQANIVKLLAAFRAAGENFHVIHVCHHSLSESFPFHPSNWGVQFEEYAKPLAGETVMSKSVNSAFIGTELENTIKTAGIERLIVVGLTTGHCVSTSVRMAANLHVVGQSGEITIVSDATAMHACSYGDRDYDGETVHTVNLATLNSEFCVVKTTEQVLESLGGG